MASTYLTRTMGTNSNQKKFTLSVWVKRNKLGGNQHPIMGVGGSGNYATNLYFQSNDTLDFWNYFNGSYAGRKVTNRKFRDINAWYHIVVAVDTTSAQSTADDRIKIYVNGVRETSFSTSSNPSQDQTFEYNSSGVHEIGRNGDNSHIFEGCMSHFYFVDGSQLAPTVFGETDSTTGEWKIKTSPDTYTLGTNGFTVLKDGNTVTDQSANSNNFSVGAGTLTKTEDCPSNVFATNNSLWKQESSRYLTHTKGNTMISGGGSGTWYQTPATLAFNSGKFYWECKFNASTNLDKNTPGVIDYEKTQESGQFQDKTGSVFFKNEDGGDYRLDASTVDSNWGTLAQNNILGVAVDMDAGTPTVKFYKNGTLLGTVNASSLAGKFVTPAQTVYTSGEYQVNYGNGYFGSTAVSSAGTNASGIGIFEHDVPSGYTALCTKGLNE